MEPLESEKPIFLEDEFADVTNSVNEVVLIVRACFEWL